MAQIRYTLKYEEYTGERNHGHFYCHTCGDQVANGVFHVHSVTEVVRRHLKIQSEELSKALEKQPQH